MANNTKQSYATSLFLVGVLYFILGFVTWLNGTLISFLKKVCELTNFQAFLVATAFFISYFVMALPSSAILKKTGFKNGMAFGLLVIAIGTLIFIPAANGRNYLYFLIGLFVEGLGLSILQTAVNPYVTILGPEESAAKRISIMGICNKAAGMISPIILGSIILQNIEPINKQIEGLTDKVTGKIIDPALHETLLNSLSHRIVTPYIVFTIALVIFAFLIRISPLPEVDETENNPEALPESQHPSLFKHTYLILGALAIFVYVGVEVIAGDSIILYAEHFKIENARFYTSITLAFMVAGYFVGILLMPKIISQETALKLYTVLALILCAGLLVTTGITSAMCLAALGFANAIMWPAIWPMALKGLGKFTKPGAALLIMGIAGGAIIPPLYGYLGDKMNVQSAYIILIPCYLYILFFAIKGHKIGYKPAS